MKTNCDFPSALAIAVAVGLISIGAATPAAAQFNPFGEPETSQPPPRKSSPPTGAEQPPLAPMDGTIPKTNGASPPSGAAFQGMPYETPPANAAGEQPVIREDLPAAPLDERSSAVDRVDLSPVMATDGSGLPVDLWQGMTVERIEQAIATLEIPPHSPALHQLFRRLVTSDSTPPGGGATNSHFTALRIEALERAGLMDEAASVLARDPSAHTDPILAVFAARSEIERGNGQRGCDIARGLAASKPTLPGTLKAEAILVSGYCAALAGNAAAAGLQADLAREQGLERSAGLDALDAIVTQSKPRIEEEQKIAIVDWRIIELAGGLDKDALIANATPGLLAALSKDGGVSPEVRLFAGEKAAALNAITADDLAVIYREQSVAGDQSATAHGGALWRAALFKSAESEQTPSKKARIIKAYLDDARQHGLYWTGLLLLEKPIAQLPPSPELASFAETAIGAALAGGQYGRARLWGQVASNSPDGLGHWLALTDIADPDPQIDRTRNLSSLEALAAGGRLDPKVLHRLATVLDALDVQVPIPLWDLASRTPQPTDGYLPQTGVLAELVEAAKKKEFGHTVLAAMQALGPNGASGANLLALGDSIRALRHAGLDADARRLGLEALFDGWPRSLTN